MMVPLLPPFFCCDGSVVGSRSIEDEEAAAEGEFSETPLEVAGSLFLPAFLDREGAVDGV